MLILSYDSIVMYCVNLVCMLYIVTAKFEEDSDLIYKISELLLISILANTDFLKFLQFLK